MTPIATTTEMAGITMCLVHEYGELGRLDPWLTAHGLPKDALDMLRGHYRADYDDRLGQGAMDRVNDGDLITRLGNLLDVSVTLQTDYVPRENLMILHLAEV